MTLVRFVLVACAICVAKPSILLAYDPLAVNERADVQSIVETLHDENRDRDVPIKIYLPNSTEACPIVIFSHGLGGSRENGTYLGKHFAKRDYVAVFVQHIGSDDSVWKGKRLTTVASELQDAASFENLVLRSQDVQFVIDKLTEMNGQSQSAAYKRMNLEYIGMCGHSFGAYTTQVLSGESFSLATAKLKDARIDAAIAYSPSAPHRGDAAEAFKPVDIPFFSMTGTQDNSPIGAQTYETRLKVFESLPASIDRYELVLDGAEHSAFGDVGRLRSKKSTNYHRSILALSTAFWDSYLKDSTEAREWLQGEGAKIVINKADRWQFERAQ